jgi:hypothetical protein
MTIQFNCPKCGALIAFLNRHVGKRAHCTTCGVHFIIPAKSHDKPVLIETPKVAQPEPGFYQAVFLDNWKVFLRRENATSLVFVLAAVCFKFFSPMLFCCAFVVFWLVWGWLFGFYLNLVSETALGVEALPEIDLGTSISFLWYVLKPWLVFVFAVVIVELPFFIALALLNSSGITYENMWQGKTSLHLLIQFLFLMGVFFFPLSVLTAAVGDGLTTLLRPTSIFVPVYKQFFPYLVVVLMLVLACLLEMHTKQFAGFAEETFLSSAGKLALNLASQAMTIVAMRSIGLFYWHYVDYFPW